MANIKVTAVDYEALHKTASTIRSNVSGETGIEGLLRKIYTEVGNLSKQNNWKGASYDKLAIIFKNNRERLENYLNYLKNTVPCTLEQITNYYSQADRNKALTIGEVTKISTLGDVDTTITETAPDASNVNLVFNRDVVIQAKEKIDDNFKSVLEQLENLYNELTKMTIGGLWMDDVSSAFCSRFKANSDNMRSTIENMQTESKEVMDVAIRNMQSAETANTI